MTPSAERAGPSVNDHAQRRVWHAPPDDWWSGMATADAAVRSSWASLARPPDVRSPTTLARSHELADTHEARVIEGAGVDEHQRRTTLCR